MREGAYCLFIQYPASPPKARPTMQAIAINEAFLTEAAVAAGVHPFGIVLQGQNIDFAKRLVKACAQRAEGGRESMQHLLVQLDGKVPVELQRFASLIVDRCAAIVAGGAGDTAGARLLAAFDVSTWPTSPEPIAHIAGACGWTSLSTEDKQRIEAIGRHCAQIVDYHDSDPALGPGYALLAHFGLAEPRPNWRALAAEAPLPSIDEDDPSMGKVAYMGMQAALFQPADWEALDVQTKAAWEAAAIAVLELPAMRAFKLEAGARGDLSA